MLHNQKALKNNGRLGRADFNHRSTPWQTIPCEWKDGLEFVILFQRVVAVSTGKVSDLGIGCGEGRGPSYFGRLQIASRKQPGRNVLFLEPGSMLLEQRETCGFLVAQMTTLERSLCSAQIIPSDYRVFLLLTSHNLNHSII